MPYAITYSYLPPGRGRISSPYSSLGRHYGQYSINPPIMYERLSRPEPTQVNDFLRVATEVPAVPGINSLSRPSAQLVTNNRARQ